jgi:hypothetical protein
VSTVTTVSRRNFLVAADSGHWMPLDAPQVVIDAITAMVADIRTQASG